MLSMLRCHIQRRYSPLALSRISGRVNYSSHPAFQSKRPERPGLQTFEALKRGAHSRVLLGASLSALVVYAYNMFGSEKAILTTTANGAPVMITTSTSPSFKIHKPDVGAQTSTPMSHLLFSEEENEVYLKSQESSIHVNRSGNPVSRVDTCRLASNAFSEDSDSFDIISTSLLPELVSSRMVSFWERWAALRETFDSQPTRSTTPANGENDLVFASVFDGHGGPATSSLLRKTFHASLALGLSNVFPSTFTSTAQITDGIQRCFLAFDKGLQEMVPDTLALMPPVVSNGVQVPQPPAYMVSLGNVDDAGACTLNVCIDVKAGDIYVSNAGDTRAVAGWWSSAENKWRCDVLTNDHMGDNPAEQERIRSLHPTDPPDNAICENAGGMRILGDLQPTRAIGNCPLKRTELEQTRVRQVLDTRYIFKGTGQKLSPPYLDACPEVSHRKIVDNPQEKLKFVILGTDGLFDNLTSEEAVLLTAAYLDNNVMPDISKKDLPSLYHLSPTQHSTTYPTEQSPGTGSRCDGGWAFEGDKNAATHLIRNSLAGNNRSLRQRLLSLRGGPDTRQMRDDITATVVVFD